MCRTISDDLLFCGTEITTLRQRTHAVVSLMKVGHKEEEEEFIMRS